MDTKLKKSKKDKIRYGSNIACVVSGTVLLATLMMLTLLYDLSYFATDNHGGGYLLEELTAVNPLWVVTIISGLVFLASLIVSFATVGERDENDEMKLNWFDKIFTDVQIVVAFGVACCIAGSALIFEDVIVRSSWYVGLWEDFVVPRQNVFWNEYFSSYSFQPYWLEVLIGVALTGAVIFICLMCMLSVVKKLKGRCFWRHTIIGKIVCYIIDAANQSEGILWKVLLILIGGSVISATWIGIIPVIILIIIYAPKMAKKFQDVKYGVEQVKSGNLDYKIPVDETANGEFDKLARNINQISEATSVAVQNELKNQRMKTDLISNVSHDLKTPLTSMVSYVDLLKREGLDSENAPGYLEIIDEKTKRLQKLTEDLFEAAKASSGAIPVNMEKIEMTSIVNQALGEMEERLKSNDLQIVFNPKADVNFVKADGQLLWRVIENLLVNTSKYALPGSRVYMDITEQEENMVLLEVKNMSKEPLNISAEELMERFKRGDDSRNTEGSGLGLAIAKDLTKLMDGEFTLTIDGDLFKASVTLQKAI